VQSECLDSRIKLTRINCNYNYNFNYACVELLVNECRYTLNHAAKTVCD